MPLSAAKACTGFSAAVGLVLLQYPEVCPARLEFVGNPESVEGSKGLAKGQHARREFGMAGGRPESARS